MTIAFVNGPVIVGDGRILEHATVLVEDERIVKVAKDDITIPPNAQKIPIDGMTLLPGFIDSHVHLCADRCRVVIRVRVNQRRSGNPADYLCRSNHGSAGRGNGRGRA